MANNLNNLASQLGLGAANGLAGNNAAASLTGGTMSAAQVQVYQNQINSMYGPNKQAPRTAFDQLGRAASLHLGEVAFAALVARDESLIYTKEEFATRVWDYAEAMAKEAIKRGV